MILGTSKILTFFGPVVHLYTSFLSPEMPQKYKKIYGRILKHIIDSYLNFLEFENFVKIWTRRPPNYHQNASKNTRKIMESSWKNIILSIWDSQNFEQIEISMS